ncbi:MAG: DUF222 domain-containing protein [Nocardioidaceae bacterium]
MAMPVRWSSRPRSSMTCTRRGWSGGCSAARSGGRSASSAARREDRGERGPRTAAERHREARSGRRVWRRPVPDGMAVLGGVVPAEHAARAWTVLEEDARRDDPDDTRTLEQRRADAFVDRLTGTHPDYECHPDDAARDYLGSGPGAGAGRRHGRGGPGAPRVAVDVVVSLDTLTGAGNAPGELAGRQLLTPAQARALAFGRGAVWRRLVTDPATGRMVAYSKQTYTPGAATISRMHTDPIEQPPHAAVSGYRPSTAVARWVRARDRQCVFPGCRRRARGCDLDHTRPWPAGGSTVANLRPLCRRHHRLKHQAGWRLVNNPDGCWTWTSPLDRRYRGTPHDYSDCEWDP